MKTTRLRLQRLKRLSQIEEGLMMPLAAELATAQTRLRDLQRQAVELRKRLEHVFGSGERPTLQDLMCREALASKLEQELKILGTQIASAESLCERAMQRLVAQKNKIRGWDTLMEKLNSSFTLEQQAEESIKSTDIYLQNYASQPEL
ncbi:MAG: hypothetical protein NXI32_13370 [bacterium]|nr:hypothetical protein [bacterium]